VLDEENIELILEANTEMVILQKDDLDEDYTIIYNTLQKDPSSSELEAVTQIYRQLRGTDPPDEETARGIIDKLFFSDKRYNLGEVGRYKINRKLGLDTDDKTLVLTKDDIIKIVKYLVSLINQKAELDDIDHLSNRRIRTVGEQLYAQFGVGLARMARTIRERMNVRDNEVFTPIDLINARTLSSVINSFFGTSQLSQFLDQTNPLSEITHKRRISALGPGGLSRERAGFEVRDVHYSHYGRLCTIETPEGPNIGLISTLCVHAKVNKMGFLETPYRKVTKGKVDMNLQAEYLSAEGEDFKRIAQANAGINEKEQLVSFEDNTRTYVLTKFRRTNQGTCINLKPIVKRGMRVTKGSLLCDGYATEKGELALGQNLMVAFMPWKGYNFEDAIVLSERVVREDIFTSLHIENFDLDIRDTKLGEEELTNDIPNVSEEATKDLDENGIIRVGAWVKEGDILIGKITPKGESDPTPEEKLLRAIFGDKAGDVKDASLKAPPSTKGVIIGKRLFARAKKDKFQKVQEKELLSKLEDKHAIAINELKTIFIDKLMVMLKGKTSQGVRSIYNEDIIPKGTKFSMKLLKEVDYTQVDYSGWTTDDHNNSLIARLLHNYNIKVNEEVGRYKREKFNISIGDELPAGVLKLAKVYMAKKRKLKVGDKLAGRHGNKGIVSRIVRVEDMPFLDDGTPVDIVLNPLGVPSRMNLGQIFETVLGWAGKELGIKYATPIFDGASLGEIDQEVQKAGLPTLGQTYLQDGETGDKFHQQWALEAYGASNILRELLTIKSDDIIGRAKAYEAIVKGENIPEPNIPESFNVLVHELRGLALDVKFD